MRGVCRDTQKVSKCTEGHGGTQGASGGQGVQGCIEVHQAMQRSTSSQDVVSATVLVQAGRPRRTAQRADKESGSDSNILRRGCVKNENRTQGGPTWVPDKTGNSPCAYSM